MLATLAVSLLLGRASFTSDYTTLTTVTSSANAGSSGAAISSSGSLVAFRSESTNLGTGATNPCVILYNKTTGTFRNCSPGFAVVSRPSISRDGKYVAFYGSTSSTTAVNVYVIDVSSGTSTPTSPGVSSTIFSVDGSTFPPSVSDSVSGTYYCAYQELQSRLTMTKPATPIPKQAMVWTIGTSTVTPVSNTSGGAAANQDCVTPVISSDAGKVAFVSTASNLISGATGQQEVFLATKSGSTWTTSELVSQSSGTAFSSPCSFPSMSSSGDILSFQCQTAVKTIDVWVRKRSTGQTFMPYDPTALYIPTPGYSSSANQMTQEASVSPDGSVIAYRSFHLMDTTHALDSVDWYVLSGMPAQVGYLGDSIYVQKITPGSYPPAYIETYHLSGSVRYTRGGYYPCLSDQGESLAFDSGQDRIDGTYQPYSMIYLRSGASW